MGTKRIFISADHGLAIIYFLQSDIIPVLLDAGFEIVVLTDDALQQKISERFGRPGLSFEGLRLSEAKSYFQGVNNTTQWWLDFLRRAGASKRINLEAVNGFVNLVEDEAGSRRKRLFPLMRTALWGLRRSRLARRVVTISQNHYTPALYRDLYNHYSPDLVITSTPGWRWDRYLLREAAKHGVPTASVIVGWDNPSSYSLPGAPVDWITCWSQIQKEELIKGSDWQAERVNIGGIPSYDGYFRKQWQLPKDEYFRTHSLDPDRKLISYASSFITFSPDIQNIKALADLITSDSLSQPCQLLIRLHPNHFMDDPRFAQARGEVQAMARDLAHVHVVEPVPLGGQMGHYSGEDMPEKSSMMAHSDVFTTVYSTMVVEACTHDTPVVSICIDSQTGWPGKFTLPLSKIGDWPTHLRFRQSGAGKVAFDVDELKQALNRYLADPNADREARQHFIRRECTFTDGSAGRRTADFFISLLQ